MGHEIKLYIGQEWNFDSTAGGKFSHSVQEIASIDLCNPGYDSRIFKMIDKLQYAKKSELEDISINPNSVRRRRASTVLYSGVIRNNREVNFYEDQYGLPLVPIPLVDVRDALAADWEDSKKNYPGWDKGYRRFYAALALINSILETFPEHTITDEELLERNPLAGQLVAIPWGH